MAPSLLADLDALPSEGLSECGGVGCGAVAGGRAPSVPAHLLLHWPLTPAPQTWPCSPRA